MISLTCRYLNTKQDRVEHGAIPGDILGFCRGVSQHRGHAEIQRRACRCLYTILADFLSPSLPPLLSCLTHPQARFKHAIQKKSSACTKKMLSASSVLSSLPPSPHPTSPFSLTRCLCRHGAYIVSPDKPVSNAVAIELVQVHTCDSVTGLLQKFSYVIEHMHVSVDFIVHKKKTFLSLAHSTCMHARFYCSQKKKNVTCSLHVHARSVYSRGNVIT